MTSHNNSSAASEDQKSPEMLAKRLRHAFTTMTNDDESKAQSERRARMMVRQDAILDAAEHIEAEPRTLLGMIAAIYGSLDAEDCAMVDREWRKFRSMPDVAQPARRGSMAAQFTYDPEGEAYYFAPLGAQPGPYYTQRHVDAILDIAFDGTLAGVELIDRVPPPPCLASQPSPAATVETSQFETTKAGVIDWKMEAERANRLLAQAERPKCRLCGLEDGACICAHLPPRLSAGSDAANALAKRLHHAAVTMQNDDISEPQSEKRRRHIERYETLIDAVDYLSAQPQGAQDPTVWLVEWPESDTVPVRWWNPAHGWMRDANAALHFARKTDADCYLSTMKIGESLKVAEHKFVTSPLSRPQSGGK
jgi:hypothetical protein